MDAIGGAYRGQRIFSARSKTIWLFVALSPYFMGGQIQLLVLKSRRCKQKQDAERMWMDGVSDDPGNLIWVFARVFAAFPRDSASLFTSHDSWYSTKDRGHGSACEANTYDNVFIAVIHEFISFTLRRQSNDKSWICWVIEPNSRPSYRKYLRISLVISMKLKSYILIKWECSRVEEFQLRFISWEETVTPARTIDANFLVSVDWNIASNKVLNQMEAHVSCTLPMSSFPAEKKMRFRLSFFPFPCAKVFLSFCIIIR